MRRWATSIAAAGGVAVLHAAAAPAAEPCDEYDPWGPARTASIVLGPGDLTAPGGAEMRSFVVTDSLGKVDVAIRSAMPRQSVGAVSAQPEVSGFSPYYGEKLKGVGVVVRLRQGARPATIVLELRQVCARYFRNTFLYY
jgi:hypothetical protein